MLDGLYYPLSVVAKQRNRIYSVIIACGGHLSGYMTMIMGVKMPRMVGL